MGTFARFTTFHTLLFQPHMKNAWYLFFVWISSFWSQPHFLCFIGPLKCLIWKFMWPQGRWEASTKTAPYGTNRQTSRQTYGHGKSMTESAQWGWFSETKAKMQQKREFTRKHHMFRTRNLHQLRKFYTSAAGDASDIKRVWQKIYS